jgi:hypothetical protein
MIPEKMPCVNRHAARFLSATRSYLAGRAAAAAALRLLGRAPRHVLDLETAFLEKEANVVEHVLIRSDGEVLLASLVRPPDLDSFVGSRVAVVSRISPPCIL